MTLELGASAYSKERTVAGDPKGGLVVEVIEERVDYETGEMVRRYRTRAHIGAKPPRLDEITDDEVDPSAIARVSDGAMRSMIRRLAKAIGERSRPYVSRQAFNRDEVVMLNDLVRLWREVGGGGA